MIASWCCGPTPSDVGANGTMSGVSSKDTPLAFTLAELVEPDGNMPGVSGGALTPSDAEPNGATSGVSGKDTPLAFTLAEVAEPNGNMPGVCGSATPLALTLSEAARAIAVSAPKDTAFASSKAITSLSACSKAAISPL
eukprot:Hpha_TRINITY_DN12305_c0_g1::TRINITY_DN12305_c0_g1_i3::g.155922::m.155922